MAQKEPDWRPRGQIFSSLRPPSLRHSQNGEEKEGQMNITRVQEDLQTAQALIDAFKKWQVSRRSLKCLIYHYVL